MLECKLGAKPKCFAEEYMIDLNATQAAIRAGYSAKTAGQIGHELLQNQDVKAYIYSLMAARFSKIRETADRVLDELCKIAFAHDGSVKTSDRLRALQTLTKYNAVYETHAADQADRLRRELDPSPHELEIRKLDSLFDATFS